MSDYLDDYFGKSYNPSKRVRLNPKLDSYMTDPYLQVRHWYINERPKPISFGGDNPVPTITSIVQNPTSILQNPAIQPQSSNTASLLLPAADEDYEDDFDSFEDDDDKDDDYADEPKAQPKEEPKAQPKEEPKAQSKEHKKEEKKKEQEPTLLELLMAELFHEQPKAQKKKEEPKAQKKEEPKAQKKEEERQEALKKMLKDLVKEEPKKEEKGLFQTIADLLRWQTEPPRQPQAKSKSPPPKVQRQLPPPQVQRPLPPPQVQRERSQSRSRRSISSIIPVITQPSSQGRRTSVSEESLRKSISSIKPVIAQNSSKGRRNSFSDDEEDEQERFLKPKATAGGGTDRERLLALGEDVNDYTFTKDGNLNRAASKKNANAFNLLKVLDDADDEMESEVMAKKGTSTRKRKVVQPQMSASEMNRAAGGGGESDRERLLALGKNVSSFSFTKDGNLNKAATKINADAFKFLKSS